MKKRSLIYIIFATVFWGTSGIFFPLLSPFGFTPVQMSVMRGGISAVVMAVFLLFYDRSRFRITAKEFLIFAFSGICIFGTSTFYYASMAASSVSVAVILMYTAPIFVMAFSVAFFGEKFSVQKGISVACMLVGCALVSGIVGGVKFNPVGVAFGLASGISYSAYNIFAKIEMMNCSDSLSASFYSFTVMGLVSLLFAHPIQMIELTAQNPPVILLLVIGIAVCTCVLPYFLYMLALRDVPVGTASTLGIIEPLAATIFSVVFFKEQLAVASICGMLLIILAVYLINRAAE